MWLSKRVLSSYRITIAEEYMPEKLTTVIALAATFLISAPLAKAQDSFTNRKIDHVLLISIDGMHAVDFANCTTGLSGVNNGAPYCPNMAGLLQDGVNYVAASTSKPSDSFPGLMTIVSGASPREMGVYYDVAYDRSLNPPAQTTGNGVAGGPCTAGATPPGTRTEYEEGIDIDQTKLNGGAPIGDGGINSINPNFLIRDKNCRPVYPWNFVRTNTIFGVIHQANGYTAWSDKHPAYSSVSGPGNGKNIDDYFSPEINSISVAMPENKIMNCNPLPDNFAFLAQDDYTGSFQNIQCYDSLKVQAILREIDGKNHDGTRSEPVPQIFGMNFQAVSIGQKLIYQDGPSVPPGYSLHGGYVDSIGTPSDSLFQEISFVDNMIGLMISELKNQNVYKSTMIVLTAKHGQSPIDLARFFPIPGHSGNNGEPPSQIIASYLPDSETGGIGPTEDDVSLLWLTDSTQTPAAVALLEANATEAGIGQIFWGPTLSIVYNNPGLPPGGDPRTPDIIVAPNVGVVYTGSKKKDMEHGGFAHDDTNVMLLVSNPSIRSSTVYAPVETAQVAPTILKALGLNPNKLDGVRDEGTTVLP
jgi:hypothetical protein